MSAEKVFNADISIHAPTRGATKCGKIRGCTMGFQSTLPRGERLCESSYGERDIQISIHAPTRGATVATSRVKGCSADFNPRSHEGSDLSWSRSKSTPHNFNPRSHEGSDLWQGFTAEYNPIISIHAPTRGATLGKIDLSEPHTDFNPRSHEGSDDNDQN